MPVDICPTLGAAQERRYEAGELQLVPERLGAETIAHPNVDIGVRGGVVT